MTTAEIQKFVEKSSFGIESDRLTLQEEIRVLLADENLAVLVRRNTLESLKDLYLSLSASKSAFELSLLAQFGTGSSSADFLQNYFNDFLKNGVLFPTKGGAIETFVHLAARQLDKAYITKLLQSKALEFYQINHLQQLKHFYFDNLRTFIDFYADFSHDYSDKDKILVMELLHMLYPTSLGENSAKDLHTFLQDIMPHFVERFKHRTDLQVYDYIDRIAEWFMVWLRYQYQIEKELGKGDEYYEMDFPTIVKYIPEFIWWNNGLYYRNGDKNFYFGSLGFFHLAKGGSVRKAPDRHHFTRRMAKVFVNLPYYFDQTEKDMYIYCYGAALGAGGLLSEMLQEFVRHHPDHTELQEELEHWNPVIQKLVDPGFEALDRYQATEFMGYIYHCIRDKPGFTVQRRTLANLLRDSNEYNARIRERAQQRDRLRQQREERAKQQKKEKLGIWKAHSSIKPYENQPYKIVELTNKQMLQQEGLIMNHCVGSYSGRCLSGEYSIWSLREFKNRTWYSLVTIELDKKKNMVQTSARFNATPSREHRKIIEVWSGLNEVNL
ncbi:MAG: hypothetical protein ACI94Y_001706 [Maribacter sp.]|jgi:hypothetical protein